MPTRRHRCEALWCFSSLRRAAPHQQSLLPARINARWQIRCIAGMDRVWTAQVGGRRREHLGARTTGRLGFLCRAPSSPVGVCVSLLCRRRRPPALHTPPSPHPARPTSLPVRLTLSTHRPLPLTAYLAGLPRSLASHSSKLTTVLCFLPRRKHRRSALPLLSQSQQALHPIGASSAPQHSKSQSTSHLLSLVCIRTPASILSHLPRLT